MKNYHPKINFTIELPQNKFLDTKLFCVNGIYSTMVNSKSPKPCKNNLEVG